MSRPDKCMSADEAIAELGAIEGVLCVRYLGAVGSDAG